MALERAHTVRRLGGTEGVRLTKFAAREGAKHRRGLPPDGLDGEVIFFNVLEKLVCT
jgi:hypothetical protein